MAYCYYNVEDYHKSYEAYRAALELDPNSEQLEKYMNLAKSEFEKYGANRKGTPPHD
jgi:tetratricopeptide (TPR) repeat protein